MDRLGGAALAARLRAYSSVPIIAGPMFLVSGPALVAACCRAGVIGSIPALNARTSEIFDGWLGELSALRNEHGAAPYAVNLIVHHTNPRLEADLEITVRHEVPIIIASVGNPSPVIGRVKAYGGLVISDVATVKHARRAAESGADALILLCAGAGGQTGWLSPFAFVSEVRASFDGPIILAGAVSRGGLVDVAERLGADMALVGTPFIAASESLAADDYRAMLIESGCDDIVTTADVTGIPANMLRKSIERSGFKPSKEVAEGPFSVEKETATMRAWREIWSAGHGVNDVKAVEPAAQIIARFADEYARARVRP